MYQPSASAEMCIAPPPRPPCIEAIEAPSGRVSTSSTCATASLESTGSTKWTRTWSIASSLDLVGCTTPMDRRDFELGAGTDLRATSERKRGVKVRDVETSQHVRNQQGWLGLTR